MENNQLVKRLRNNIYILIFKRVNVHLVIFNAFFRTLRSFGSFHKNHYYWYVSKRQNMGVFCGKGFKLIRTTRRCALSSCQCQFHRWPRARLTDGPNSELHAHDAARCRLYVDGRLARSSSSTLSRPSSKSFVSFKNCSL